MGTAPGAVTALESSLTSCAISLFTKDLELKLCRSLAATSPADRRTRNAIAVDQWCLGMEQSCNVATLIGLRLQTKILPLAPIL